MQDLVTGIYCGCHKLPGQQTFSQTSPKIPDTAVNKMGERVPLIPF